MISKKDKIEYIFKCIFILGAIVSFLFGIYKYEIINKDNSAHAFWDKQFPIYEELCRKTSILATTLDSVKYKTSLDDFWRMYYGEARMVVDWQVHQKMSNVGAIIKDIERGFKSQDDLKLASFELATQCRKSLAESWDIPLSNLKTE